MLIVMDGESVRDYHDSVGQFDRGQIPPPSLAGKGAGGLGFPKRANKILSPPNRLDFFRLLFKPAPKVGVYGQGGSWQFPESALQKVHLW